MSSKILNPEELSIAELVKNRAASGKRTGISKSSGAKSRNLVKPVKPLFEGKSLEEALPRRNSDSSVSSHHLRKILDDDDVSVSSVQNLETIPSVTESAGILSIISSNFRKSRSVTERHIGELPNRRQLQTDTINSPVVTTNIQQSSGAYATTSPTDSSGHTDDSGSSNPSRLSSIRPSLLSPSGGNAPKRKDSLGLFRGASLRMIIKQADSNHRRMVELEDSEHSNFANFSGMSNGITSQNDTSSSPSTSARNSATTSIPEETHSGDKHTESNARRRPSSRRPKRNASSSSATSDEELDKARSRMRGTRRKNGQTDGEISTPKRSQSRGKGNSTKSGDRTSQTSTEEELNDSFAWFPIVQSHDFLSPQTSGTRLSLDDEDSKKGYSSDSSEYHHKSRARWHMSKEGQQVQERIRQQNHSLAETLATSAGVSIEDDADDDAKNGPILDRARLDEWYDASGNAAVPREHIDDQSHAYQQRPSNDAQKEIFCGKSLEDALPAETRNLEANDQDPDFGISMPSLASITVKTEDGSLISDAFTKQHASKEVKYGVASNDDATHIAGPSRPDPKASIVKEHRRRQLDALDLELSNHEASNLPKMKTYEWESSKTSRMHRVQNFEQDSKLYPATSKKTHPSNSKAHTLKFPRPDESLRKSEHSEASTMGESYVMEKVSETDESEIFESASRMKTHNDSKEYRAPTRRLPCSKSDNSEDLRNVKKKTKKAMQAIEKAFGSNETLTEPDTCETVVWERVVHNTHLDDDKTYPIRKTGDLSPVTNASNSVIGDPDEYKKEKKTSTMWLPPMEWQDVNLGHKEDGRCYPEDWAKDQNRTEAKMKPKKNRERSTTPQDKVKSKTPKLQSKKKPKSEAWTKSSSKTPFVCKDEIDSDLGPFSTRPSIAGPFAMRPEGVKEIASECPTQLDVLRSSFTDKTSQNDTEMVLPNANHVDDDDDDDDRSTQSVDRHLVRESSHRRLLRKQVADQRESLQSILQATKRHAAPEEDDLLSLKRKLALSQALVQKLELENAKIKRDALLKVSRVQMALLEQRDNREEELEAQLKLMMVERNAAVEECHVLRGFLVGTCDRCKMRFDENKQYFMDHYVRKTIFSKRKSPRSSAFEWFSENLSTEALDLETNTAFRNQESVDKESYSVGGTSMADSDAASFQSTPLSWLSEQLFTDNNEAIVGGDIPVDAINVGRDKNQNDSVDTLAGNSLCDSCLNDNMTNANSITASLEESDSKSKRTVPKSKRNFFASLIGEKVIDEFASVALLANKDSETVVSRGFSLFGGLRREEVKEDPVFMGIGRSLSVIKEGKEVPQEKKRKGFWLKDEQVLDDMELLNSLQQLGNQPSKDDSDVKKRMGLRKVADTSQHSLAQETVDIAKHDDQLLSLLNKSSPSNFAKTTSKRSLREERVDEDVRDISLLASPGLLSPRKDPTKEQPSVSGSNLSSPFTWKRNHAKPKIMPKNFGKYKFSMPSPSQSKTAVDTDSTGLGSISLVSPVSLKAGNNSASPRSKDERDLDDKDRPWRSKGAKSQVDASEVFPTQVASEAKLDLEVDEIDQVACLVEQESSSGV